MEERTYTQKQVDGLIKQAVDNTTRQTLVLISRYADTYRAEAKEKSVEFVKTDNPFYRELANTSMERVFTINSLKTFLKKEFKHFLKCSLK